LAETDLYLVVAFDPETKIVLALVAYMDDREIADVESLFNMPSILNYLRSVDEYDVATALEQSGTVSNFDDTHYLPSQPVNERFTGSRDSWSILPATMALYNKRVVDIVTAASCWSPGPETILVCSKSEGSGRSDKVRLLFVASSGDSYDYYLKDIGKSFETHHDQTGVSKGFYKIENVVIIADDKIAKSANAIGLNIKASLSVFK
jgi:hypothetical protein